MSVRHHLLAAIEVLMVGLACAAPGERVEPVPVKVSDYPWLAEARIDPSSLVRLEDRFPPPAGCSRVRATEGGYAAWLRGLPVYRNRTEVRSYRGLPVAAPAAAVVALDVGDGDLQQCADTILRLRAEFEWARGRGASCAYHFTSGDLSSYQAWLAGERFRIVGPQVERVPGPPRDPGHATFRQWLQHLFRYAGTLSLPLDSQPVAPLAALEPGDFFVDGGSPGHAVVVLDVVQGADGRRLGLIGQGFTPAQELHVLQWPRVAVDTVWFPLPDQGGALETPSWRAFPRDAARRFPAP